ncbi:hypothetical protein TNCV_2650141 [Trichonephila clavipes]|nr:hypothetical protein TNCV_2650141 [Trichonephila clavipes]
MVKTVSQNFYRRFCAFSRDPSNLDESINAALIEEQNMKLNQIASEERSGLSSAQTENPVLSALADRLEEINLRVGRLQPTDHDEMQGFLTDFMYFYSS